ncbi:hypothetical protein INR49_018656 [Caranx melampygus]|nr:hypothetical protein INR49_018656 [Caranx melampygus]
MTGEFRGLLGLGEQQPPPHNTLCRDGKGHWWLFTQITCVFKIEGCYDEKLCNRHYKHYTFCQLGVTEE